jgi:hypothetical protein
VGCSSFHTLERLEFFLALDVLRFGTAMLAPPHFFYTVSGKFFNL